MRKFFVLAAVAFTALTAAVGPAAAAAKYRVNFDGRGTYALTRDGAAVLSGTATGERFDGTYTAILTASDGSVPEPGLCEDATVTVKFEGARARFIELVSTGQVCGQYLQPPYVVTQVFTAGMTSSMGRRSGSSARTASSRSD